MAVNFMTLCIQSNREIYCGVYTAELKDDSLYSDS